MQTGNFYNWLDANAALLKRKPGTSSNSSADHSAHSQGSELHHKPELEKIWNADAKYESVKGCQDAAASGSTPFSKQDYAAFASA